MDRREFLEHGSTLALALPLAGIPDWTSRGPDRMALARPETLSRLGDPDLPRTLGRRYRAAFPEEDDPLLLRRALRLEAGPMKGATLSAGLQDRIRQDFAEDRTVELEGWILARTEARQCALASYAFPPTDH